MDYKDLKPGDRFRLTEAVEDYEGLTEKAVYEGVVQEVDETKGCVYAVGGGHLFAHDHRQVWERLAPAEPKNLGAVVEFNDIGAVRVGDHFVNSRNEYLWADILELDPNPRVMHAGWDGS